MRRRFPSRCCADAQVPLSPRAYTREISHCLVSAKVGQLGKELATCVAEPPNGVRLRQVAENELTKRAKAIERAKPF